MHSVLFVCTANICRSPMAMGLWQEKISQSGVEWRVESAGTWGDDGHPVSQNSQLLLKNRGIDISQHRSHIITRELLEPFNLILVMEHGHKEALRAEFPDLARRVFLLSEMIGGNYEIRDPFSGSMVDYQETEREIDQILTDGFEKICQLAAGEDR